MGAVLAEQPDRAIRDLHNSVTKLVATSTPLDRDWANATVIDDGLIEFVRDLKQQPGRDVGVHGSISVAQALLAADVVDELRLAIGPMIAGPDDDSSTACHRCSSNRSERRSHRVAIWSSTIASFARRDEASACSCHSRPSAQKAPCRTRSSPARDAMRSIGVSRRVTSQPASRSRSSVTRDSGSAARGGGSTRVVWRSDPTTACGVKNDFATATRAPGGSSGMASRQRGGAASRSRSGADSFMTAPQ